MKWLVLLVALAACEGPMGPPGPSGKDGQDGADASGLIGIYHCSGTASVNANIGLLHDVYMFADGSVLATCYVWGAVSSVSGTNMWRSGSNGARDGSCLVTADVDSASFGFWTFDMSSLTTSIAAYNDPSSVYDGRAFVLTCKSQ